jgi:hypothetical protein
VAGMVQLIKSMDRIRNLFVVSYEIFMSFDETTGGNSTQSHFEAAAVRFSAANPGIKQGIGRETLFEAPWD